MDLNTKNCPICPRGCDLTAPHCERGREYARTGSIPQNRGQDPHHGNAPRLHFEKREQQMVMKYLHHATGVADRGGFTQEQAEELFSVLTEEETLQLARLLEKLSDYWIQIAPNKPSHH